MNLRHIPLLLVVQLLACGGLSERTRSTTPEPEAPATVAGDEGHPAGSDPFAHLFADELPPVRRIDVRTLEVRRPSEPAVRLERNDHVWRVVDPVQSDVDESALDTALDKIVDMEAASLVSEDPDEHERLGVDEAHAIRVVVGDGERVLTDLFVGGYADGTTMVRLHGRDAVIAVPGSILFAFNKPLKDWRNRRVVDASPHDVIGITFTNGRGTVRFSRPDHDWIAELGAELVSGFSPRHVNSVVSSLSRFRAMDFAPEDANASELGFGDESPRVSLELGGDASSVSLTLELGGEADGGRYVRRSDRETIWIVSEYLVARMLAYPPDPASTP